MDKIIKDATSNPTTRFCHNCRKEGQLTSKFCAGCGVGFPKEEPCGRHCENCGIATFPGANYCHSCNRALGILQGTWEALKDKKDHYHCKMCGEKLEKKDQFCGECGKQQKISDSAKVAFATAVFAGATAIVAAFKK